MEERATCLNYVPAFKTLQALELKLPSIGKALKELVPPIPTMQSIVFVPLDPLCLTHSTPKLFQA